MLKSKLNDYLAPFPIVLLFLGVITLGLLISNSKIIQDPSIDRTIVLSKV